MNEQLKKRLVGAIVLVALAVIFVPMLLEGDKRNGIPLFGSNVPEAPESHAPMVDIPLQVPPPSVEAPVVVERELPPEPAPVAPAAPVAAVPAPPPVVAPAPAAQPKPAAPAPTTVKPVKPAEVASSQPAAESWAVQVGSFSEQANASRLRDSLRGKGYPAYVERVKLSSGTAYRVRVGPVLTRADAESIQAKLAKIDQRGIVVPHP
ncbi:SPOR domain-containing protein [Sulfurivermis fontis]|uniref:SPOR domain-containing protein n=1 Tax=Sulfurivermis fontis TaxID=1972068 RepID=UPI000FDC9186|nr:SPOR domain-containing protein [Sulfurivermis fontis]